MKTTLCSLLTALLVCSAFAAPEAAPRFKAQVACFNGAVDHGSSCTGTCFQPDGTMHTDGKMTCGIPGQVSEITWAFVERRGDKDVYHFTRRFPTDAADVAVSSKDVEFGDQRVVVFTDEHQTILIEPSKP